MQDHPGGHEKQISDLFELAAQGCNPGKIGAAVGALSQINVFEENAIVKMPTNCEAAVVLNGQIQHLAIGKYTFTEEVK